MNEFPLVEARKSAGFESTDEAAEALGISRVYLFKIQRGESLCGLDTMDKIALLYGRESAEIKRMIIKTRLAYLMRETDLLTGTNS
jgi:helix-turn-helix protein